MKTVFVDVERCVGCRHCELACARAHQEPVPDSGQPLGPDSPRSRISVELGVDFLTFPLKCRHCNPAPCVQVCPTGALYRDPEFDTVLIQEDLCISCGMCAMVCPFGAMTFAVSKKTGKKTAYKCDNCIDRQKKDQLPACVEACKTGALTFGYVNEIIKEAKKNIVLDLTRTIQGGQKTSIPENMLEFQAIRETLARLGPLPSSK
ncbi:MAG: 4Fe-4S binding protein [Desulfoplanes sp.]|nr:4Fe-4S binding protein [Desulfoplanes sp.]